MTKKSLKQFKSDYTFGKRDSNEQNTTKEESKKSSFIDPYIPVGPEQNSLQMMKSEFTFK